MNNNDIEFKNELEDFEAFLESDFEPLQFANELLLATNGNDNPELDLATPIKKLRFDIDECDKRMSSIASSNYESLVANFSKIEGLQSILTDRMNPAVEQVNAPFKRIKQEIIEPYEEAVKLNNALKRIHLTLDLLRSASFFIFLIQQLEELQKPGARNAAEESGNKDLVRLAKLHVQIKQLYENAVLEKSKDVNILSIKLIRDYQPTETTRRAALISECSQILNKEFNHQSGINEKNQQLQTNLMALYILNKKEFFNVFDKATIVRQVNTAGGQLSRALQSPRNFTAIMSEVKEGAKEYFDKLEELLSVWHVFKENEDERISFLKEILLYYKENSLSDIFWSKLALKFKKNIAATMARGGPIAKNLRIYFEGLNNSISETFTSEYERELMLDALSLIGNK
ncbi:COG5 [[Candida] subhashii]|uniref:Conserved oligomeric Golgi complex subunit 5 n=1 Tax=[Candida] subhashii TaxID=561895 RepID=A0A8J5UKG6_9ASCO|nr:COG5 [[Candida] subhashii]KAG7661981.1 COG5 [[Candida] subhashii]